MRPPADGITPAMAGWPSNQQLAENDHFLEYYTIPKP